MQADMTKGSPMKIILFFMMPLFLGNLFQNVYNMVDSMIVGHYVGQNALAAVGSTGTIMFLVLGFAAGLTSGFTVLTSQRFGAGDEEGVQKSVANAILLSVLVIIAMTALSLVSLRGLLRMMNTPDEIFDDAYSYIFVICAGTFANVGYNLFAAMLRAIGNSKVPLITLLISAGLNILLDLLFIVYFRMGTAGAAYATVIAQTVSAVLCALYILKSVPVLTPSRHHWALDRSISKMQMSVGLPMALQFGITASGTIIMQSALNLYGAVAVAGVTAANKVQMLISAGNTAIGQTIATYAGQNYGAGRYDRLVQGIKATMLIILVYGILEAAFSLLFLKPFVSIFFAAGTDLSEMMPYATTYMQLCAICFIPLGWIFLFRNFMQSCGHGLFPLLGGVVELASRVFLSILSGRTKYFPFAAGCDAFAWVTAGVFVMISCWFVMKKIKLELAFEPEYELGNL